MRREATEAAGGGESKSSKRPGNGSKRKVQYMTVPQRSKRPLKTPREHLARAVEEGLELLIPDHPMFAVYTSGLGLVEDGRDKRSMAGLVK